MKFSSYLLIALFLFFSCTEKETKTIWVYPYRLSTAFYPNAQAGDFFLIQDKEDLNYSSWNLRTESFEIQGFDFEEGFFYKLKVEYEADQPPQKLKSALEKRKDWIDFLEGVWENIPLPDRPYLPIFIRVQKLSRTLETYGGCAKGITGMGEVGERKIQLADTYYQLELDKICLAQNPGIGGNFSFVGYTTEYQLTKEGFLEFFDESENLLIRFQPYE